MYYVYIRCRRSDLRCPVSFSRATPRCCKHPRTPSHAVGIWAEPFAECTHPVGLASGEKMWKIRVFGKSGPEKGPWTLAILKACGLMKCAYPLNGYLRASLNESVCNRTFFPVLEILWRGVAALQRCQLHENCGGHDLEEALWG